MDTATPEMRALARRLIALEVARDHAPAAAGACRVCDKLRGPLARLAGIASFRALLSRALALAKAEVAALNPVQVRQDGSLAGLDAAGPGAGGDGGTAVVTHMLGLLVLFISDALTRQLVRDVWPDATAAETDGRAGGQP